MNQWKPLSKMRNDKKCRVINSDDGNNQTVGGFFKIMNENQENKIKNVWKAFYAAFFHRDTIGGRF